MQADLIYNLTEEGRKASLIAGGDGKRSQVTPVDITESDLAFCQVDDDGRISFLVKGVSTTTAYVDVPLTSFAQAAELAAANKATSVENLAKERDEKEKRLLARIAEGHSLLGALVSYAEWMSPDTIAAAKAFNAEAQRRVEEKRERQRAADAEKDAAAAAAREVYKSERAEWIYAHGSAYLSLATVNGYNCERRYAQERCAIEYPGFVVDFDDNATWNKRSCPSEAALFEAVTINNADKDTCEVVWLTCAPFSRDDTDETDDTDESFESCEALVIIGWLGKYDLVKIV